MTSDNQTTARQDKMSLDSFIKDPRNQKFVLAARIGSGFGLIIASAGLIFAREIGERSSTTDMMLCAIFGSMGMTLLISEAVSMIQKKARS